ncbi:hypothetical protein FKM82_031138, partial [Ascaphus truei]
TQCTLRMGRVCRACRTFCRRLCRSMRAASTMRNRAEPASCCSPSLCCAKPPAKLCSISSASAHRGGCPCTNSSWRCWRPKCDPMRHCSPRRGTRCCRGCATRCSESLRSTETFSSALFPHGSTKTPCPVCGSLHTLPRRACNLREGDNVIRS